MDSWESKRHNTFPYDNLRFVINKEHHDNINSIINYQYWQKGTRSPHVVDLIAVSTMYHDGNHADACGLVEIRKSETEEIEIEILPCSLLQGHAIHWYF